ncbi:MAG: AraC family transcriptional regulator [Polyangiales bacterium]
MPKTPRKLAEAPKPLALQAPRGDVVADMLGSALIRHVLYRPLHARAPWGLRVPQRDRACFYLISAGSARLEVQGARARPLSPGEVAFIPHGTAHILRDAPHTQPIPVCDGPSTPSLTPRRTGGRGALSVIIAGFFDLRPGIKLGILSGMPSCLILSAHNRDVGAQVAATVQLIAAESAAPQPASTIVLQRLADVLFVLALRQAAAHGACKGSGLAAVADPRIYEALNLMHGQVAAPWNVADLAHRVGMSRSAFAAHFSQLVGQSPVQYLARWRAERAAELLRDTDDKVATIAARVGYESIPAFSRAFKRWQKTSPATYRRHATNTKHRALDAAVAKA